MTYEGRGVYMYLMSGSDTYLLKKLGHHALRKRFV